MGKCDWICGQFSTRDTYLIYRRWTHAHKLKDTDEDREFGFKAVNDYDYYTHMTWPTLGRGKITKKKKIEKPIYTL